MIDRLTPHIDEQKEIVRGNQAVAKFYGLVSAAVSIVVASAVLGGLQSGAGLLSPPYTIKQHFKENSSKIPAANRSEPAASNTSQ